MLESNNPDQEDIFKIMIKEEMVWNLIEEAKEYFVRFSDNENRPKELEYIQH